MTSEGQEPWYRLRQRDVTHERLDGEVIAVNLLTGRYYSMSGTAADIWSATLLTGTARGAQELLAAVYTLPVQADAEIESFLDRCVEAELFEVTGAAGIYQQGTDRAALPEDFPRTSWLPPNLEEYEDLQDLILVDPIHDTSALGWPHIDEDDEATEVR